MKLSTDRILTTHTGSLRHHPAGECPLARHCDILLHTVAKETKFRPEAMSSRVAQLAVIDTLVSRCALAAPGRSVEMLQRSNRVLSGKRY